MVCVFLDIRYVQSKDLEPDGKLVEPQQGQVLKLVNDKGTVPMAGEVERSVRARESPNGDGPASLHAPSDLPQIPRKKGKNCAFLHLCSSARYCDGLPQLCHRSAALALTPLRYRPAALAAATTACLTPATAVLPATYEEKMAAGKAWLDSKHYKRAVACFKVGIYVHCTVSPCFTIWTMYCQSVCHHLENVLSVRMSPFGHAFHLFLGR